MIDLRIIVRKTCKSELIEMGKYTRSIKTETVIAN